MSWSDKYKRSIDCDSPQGFSQKAHCAARKKRSKGEETVSKSPFKESNEVTSYTKFTHKTKHLSKSQHQLDPNLDLKHLVHHTVHQYVDRDADGDIDVYDKPGKKTPDENVSSAVKAQEYSKKLIAKQKGELKHTRRGMAYEETMNEEGLRDWFGKSKSKDGKPGWVNVVTGGTCASDEPGEGTPKCVSSAKRASMTKAERLSAARRKKAADPGQQQKTGAAKPTYVSTDRPKKKMKEELDLQEAEKAAKKDACYHKVKSRYKVWPSAYASGALVKCRKVGADSWGTKSEAVDEVRYCPACQKGEMREECKYGPKYWDMFSQPIDLPEILVANRMKYDPNKPHPTNEQKDHEYSMARSEISTIISAAKRLKKKMGKGEGSLEAWVQSKITKAADYLDTAADYVESGEHNVDEAKKCWPGYKKVGTQKLFGKTYNRCVKEGYSNWREELAEDWQSVNRKDKTDGLSQKAVNAYRRENPGSKLQTAVTEKNPEGKRAKRRASFCRRMKGMKEKLTSAETSRDPDSRINKALRRWNCN
jgi:hypothetical protein